MTAPADAASRARAGARLDGSAVGIDLAGAIELLLSRGTLALCRLRARLELLLRRLRSLGVLLGHGALSLGDAAGLLGPFELAVRRLAMSRRLRGPRPRLHLRLVGAPRPAASTGEDQPNEQNRCEHDEDDHEPRLHRETAYPLRLTPTRTVSEACPETAMAELDIDTVLEWRGRLLRDRDGNKVGRLGEIFLDAEDDRPAWGGVHTGLFGRRESLVPLSDVRAVDDELHVPYTKAHIEGAPGVEPDVSLSPDEEARLYRHFGRDDPAEAERAPADVQPGAVAAGDRDDASPGPEAGPVSEPGAPARGEDAEAEMIRSEEEVRVRPGPPRPVERVRLKKYIVTENVTREVPVRREEIRLEHEPPPEGEIVHTEEITQDVREDG